MQKTTNPGTRPQATPHLRPNKPLCALWGDLCVRLRALCVKLGETDVPNAIIHKFLSNTLPYSGVITTMGKPCFAIIAFACLLLASGAEPPRTVRATGIIRAVHSQTILVPRIEGLGGSLTIATLAGNGAIVSPGDSLATFDRANEVKLLLEAQTKFDDLAHQIEQKKALNNSNAEKRIADLQQAQADLKKAEIESRKGPVLSSISRRIR